MHEETDRPPPVPPKTKSAVRPSCTSSIYSGGFFENNSSQVYHTARTARSTTVNLNAVECSSIPGYPDSDFGTADSRRRTSGTTAKNHVVKILINPEETKLFSADETVRNSRNNVSKTVLQSDKNCFSENSNAKSEKPKCGGDFVSVRKLNSFRDFSGNISKTILEGEEKCSEVFGDGSLSPCIRISVNNNSGVPLDNNMVDTIGQSSPFYFYNPFNGVMSSGQVSPSDTLDSGTCSDMDGTPPPLPKKKNSSSNGISVTLIGNHKKALSCSSGVDVDSDNDSNNSSLSCDSLNSSNVPSNTSKFSRTSSNGSQSSSFPQTLLQDIRLRNNSKDSAYTESIVDEKSYSERQEEAARLLENLKLQEEVSKVADFNTDMFYKFHLNEKDVEEVIVPTKSAVDDESFAGYKDLLGDGAATIRSAKGTVRGVKNRVRAGIATFLQINTNERNYKEKDGNKVVVYTTTMGIIRDTYQACMKVKQILRTLLVKFEERDVFMSSEYQTEIRDRMKCDQILVPQVYVDGQHVGDAETIERLNESGELRKLLKPYKSPDACSTCQICGGYRLLPCHVCNGSKKSVHRNHFTTEFVALKCMNCDDAGLVKCSACSL